MKSTKSGQSNFSEQPPRRRICASRIVPLLLLWMLPAGLGLMMAGRASAQTFTTLYDFSALSNSTNSDGAFPYAGLNLSGNTLYGTADGGGGNGYGTVFSLALPAGVEAQLAYMTNNGAVTISAYRGSGGVVNIPSVIAGLPVTSISDSAFAGCTSLTSVTIPNSVTNIGDSVFSWCTGLASVTIPSSVTSIGGDAFYSCTSLSSVIIPNSVTTIGDDAFYNCTSLSSVTIANSVTNIGDHAFSWCWGLASVYFQGNAPSCGTNVFDYWEGWQGAGESWDPATIYYLPGTTGWSTNFAGLPAFLWDSLASMGYTTSNGTVTITRYTGPGGDVTIPSTINGQPVASIGGYYDPYGNWFGAFQGCTNLTSVTIPNSVTSIGGGAFSGCGSLTAITVDTRNPVYSDVDGVLFNQSLTTLVEYPEGIAGSYTIPNSVTKIGDSAFIYCTSLTSVTIPNSVTTIRDSAFCGCTSLTSVTIPNSVTTIGDDAFGGSGLTSVTIPDSVTNIGYYAFYDCTSLTSVTIGRGVTTIGLAFQSCSSLRSVPFEGNAPSLSGSDVFYGENKATAYYLPGTTGWSTNFAGLPTELWVLPNPLILTSSPSFGVQTNRFGFIISWATNIPVVVEASTNLANTTWSPISTNTLTGGSSYFSDPQWTNYPARFYRLRSP